MSEAFVARPNPDLPILLRRAEIEAALRTHQCLVLSGETGSGKTTQLPQICLGMGLTERGAVAHTQPRRIAARAVAARIAQEQGTPLGRVVGFKVRFEDKTSSATRIKVMTDGTLLAELASDPDLRAYSVVILDEAHERSVNIDFLLGCLTRLLPRRPDLKLIVTSATIDSGRFSEFLGGPSLCPAIEVSGRLYPVEVRYREGDTAQPHRPDPERFDPEVLADAVEDVARPSAGHILAFLPGEREIRLCADAVRRRGFAGEVLPLYSRLSSEDQDRIFSPAPVQRLILATNIAETSLTVPGIQFVIDSGLARLTRYDPQRKVQRLPTEWTSRAAARQRAGRAGRISAGVCIRLYPKALHDALPEFTQPEITRSNLANVILQMKAQALGPIEDFPLLDPPAPAAVADGYETLFEVGAIESAHPDAVLTLLGRRLARVPVDVRIARILLAAEPQRCVPEAIILAAALSIQDPRQRPPDREGDADRAQAIFRHDSSDFLTLLKLWDQFQHHCQGDSRSGEPGNSVFAWCRDHFLSFPRMREWSDTIRQLRDVAHDLKLPLDTPAASEDAVHRALLTGLLCNVAARDGAGGSFEYRGPRSESIHLHPSSVLFKKGPRWIVAAELVQTSRLFARTLARIEPEWIEELAGHMFQHQRSDPHLDSETGEPSAWERVTFGKVVVVPRRRVRLAPSDPAQARGIFLRDALVGARWKSEHPIPLSVRTALDQAALARGKVRRRDVAISDDSLLALLDRRLSPSIHDPASLDRWWGGATPEARQRACIAPSDVLTDHARLALDPTFFPDAMHAESPPDAAWPLTYSWSPGKDHDGLTLSISLQDLPRLSVSRMQWLVPGLLPDLTLALLRSLPRGQQSVLTARTPLPRIAADVAAIVAFGQGSLTTALCEAISVLHSVVLDPAALSPAALPEYLHLRLRVLDNAGDELAVSRDLPALLKRFSQRIEREAAARAKSSLERERVTSWDFGSLPESLSLEADGVVRTAYPTLIDQGTHASLALLDSAHRADCHRARGMRRLFSLACFDELSVYLESSEVWHEVRRLHDSLGPASKLLTCATALAAERTFLWNQSIPRCAEEFEARLQSLRPRLSAGAREVAATLAGTLEPRARIAHRLGGGTPRIWAASTADIREHASYLFPDGFLSLVSWERFRHYPRLMTAMRERLLNLREGGSTCETPALALVLPHWKRFTLHVARAMADAPGSDAPAVTKSPAKAALPQNRRAAPRINTDAGVWALSAGNLSRPADDFRWGVEELRAAAFNPETFARAHQLAAALPALMP